MTKASFSKIGNVEPTEPIIKKLRIMDYVFCYKGVDFNNAELKYFFDKIQTVEYENGERKEDKFSPAIDFSISAKGENNRICTFDFMLNMGVDDLNKFPNKPININEYIIGGESFFFDSDSDSKAPEFMDFDLEESIYHFTPSFLVQKLDNNKFAFKIQYQDLFIWFHINFDEK